MNNKIKPGDLFEWIYKGNNLSVFSEDELYSYAMEKYVPCSGLCLCVGISADIIYWVSIKGLFHTRDVAEWSKLGWGLIIPHKVQS